MKEQTMTSINKALKEEAKKRGLNFSELLEEALRSKVKPTSNDVNPSQVLFKCSQCGKVVENGYYCSISHDFWCEDCEKSLRMCIYAKQEEKEPDGRQFHEHHPMPNKHGIIDKNDYRKVCYSAFVNNNRKNPSEDQNA